MFTNLSLKALESSHQNFELGSSYEAFSWKLKSSFNLES